LHPSALTDPTWNYLVLGIAFIFEFISYTIAMRKFREEKGKKGFFLAMKRSKDTSLIVVLMEDTAALIGLVIAFIGVFLAHHFQSDLYDAMASILIGLLLACVASFLAFESRGLLLGESADPETLHSISEIAKADPAVHRAKKPLTMHFGPEEILLNLAIEFKPELSSEEVALAIERVERAIRTKHPEIKRIYIEADSIKSPQKVRNT
jgi:divalent metal cation (Fe/Co/Zn/Cd) transporter